MRFSIFGQPGEDLYAPEIPFLIDRKAPIDITMSESPFTVRPNAPKIQL